MSTATGDDGAQRLAAMRREYQLAELDETSIDPDPLVQLRRWLDEAAHARVPEPNAMTLATVDAGGAPAARIVLLKEVDHGLVFYSNYASDKGRELDARPLAALVFVWLPLERQVRVTGRVEKVTRGQSEAYFRSRPRASQIGALASRQSRVVAGREPLQRRFDQLERQYRDTAVPLPENWGGYRVLAQRFEFWQGRRSRLHDRLRYRDDDGRWLIERLEP